MMSLQDHDFFRRLIRVLREFWVLALPQIGVLVGLPHPWVETHKGTLFLVSVAVSLLVVLPIRVLLTVLKRSEREQFILRLYKALALILKNAGLVTDQFHHIYKFESDFDISGSDGVQTILLNGVNAHPDGLTSTELVLLGAGDADSDKMDIEVYDLLTDSKLKPELVKILGNVQLARVAFKPTGIGEPMRLQIKRSFPGAFTNRREYVFTGIDHFERGCDEILLTVSLDRQVQSYAALTLDDGEIVACDDVEYLKPVAVGEKFRFGIRIVQPKKDYYILEFVS